MFYISLPDELDFDSVFHHLVSQFLTLISHYLVSQILTQSLFLITYSASFLPLPGEPVLDSISHYPLSHFLTPFLITW